MYGSVPDALTSKSEPNTLWESGNRLERLIALKLKPARAARTLKKGVRHEEWSSWEPPRADVCEEVSRCTRCGEEKHHRLDHVWDSWHYASPKSCDQIRFCARCHEKQERTPKHAKDHEGWTQLNYVYPNVCNMFERHCIRCSESVSNFGLPLHDYGPWERLSATKEERMCQRCRHRDSRYIYYVIRAK
jgi:hypothetical protein